MYADLFCFYFHAGSASKIYCLDGFIKSPGAAPKLLPPPRQRRKRSTLTIDSRAFKSGVFKKPPDSVCFTTFYGGHQSFLFPDDHNTERTAYACPFRDLEPYGNTRP